MQPLKTLIDDDEWPVRAELKTMLAGHPEIAVAGEAANVVQAIPLIQDASPEVIFLDIQMPGASGFDLLDQIDVSARIIFISEMHHGGGQLFLHRLCRQTSRARFKNLAGMGRAAPGKTFFPHPPLDRHQFRSRGKGEKAPNG